MQQPQSTIIDVPAHTMDTEDSLDGTYIITQYNHDMSLSMQESEHDVPDQATSYKELAAASRVLTLRNCLRAYFGISHRIS